MAGPFCLRGTPARRLTRRPDEWFTGQTEFTKAEPMMNRMESAGEAKIRYLDGDFEILKPGAYVRCAVTGEAIPLDMLRYWSVARQEPYATAAVSLKRELDANPVLAARAAAR
jgi:hypothetical protein